MNLKVLERLENETQLHLDDPYLKEFMSDIFSAVTYSRQLINAILLLVKLRDSTQNAVETLASDNYQDSAFIDLNSIEYNINEFLEGFEYESIKKRE